MEPLTLAPLIEKTPYAPMARETERPVVLVVDDQDSVREVLTLALEVQNCTVRQASNGRQAIELCREIGAALRVALVDRHMPDLSGLETITAIRELAPHAACCLITGDGCFTAAERTQLWDVMLVWKPFNLFELLPQLRAFITP